MLFISSTVSNKIVIGAEEEITTTTAAPPPAGSEKTEPALIDFSPGRSFPSFPIRGDDSPSIKPKLDFSRRNKAAFKFGKSTPVNEKEEVEEEREENVSEQNEFSSTAEQLSTTTTTPAEAVSKTQFVVTKTQPRGKFPRVKSNLLFNRKNKERFRLKLAQLSGRKSTTTTTTTTTTTSDLGPSSTSPPASEIPATTKGSLFTPRKKFNLRKKPQTFFKVPNVSITNSLLKFRNRAKFNSQPEKEETAPSETTVAEEVSTESVLSVQTELDQQEEEEEEQQSVQLGGQLDHVRKAHKAPLNGNIRVEFKKKAAELTGNRGRFFINPDGRKPRVKSNIRAHLANRGQHFAEQQQAEDSGETFDGASSQLDLTPFNNIKREVDNAEAPGEVEGDVLTSHNEIVDPVPTKPVPIKPVPIKPVKPLTFALPLLPLEPVILNPRQANRNNNNKKPPLPASILKHINHITDIRSLPPLPPNLTLGLPKRPTKAVTEERSQPSGSHTALLDQIVVESPASPAGEQTQPQVQPTVPFTTAGTSKLSAFRALQQQVERREEEPSLVSLV